MHDEEKQPMIHLFRRDSGVASVGARILGIVPAAAHRRNILGVLEMEHIIHWFATNASILAILVTVGVAVLLVCCLGCSNCPSRDKDDLFRRHGM